MGSGYALALLFILIPYTLMLFFIQSLPKVDGQFLFFFWGGGGGGGGCEEAKTIV